MVLVDSVPVVNRFPSVWTNLLGKATYEEVIGLHDNLGFAKDEWQTIVYESKLNEAFGGIAEKELELMSPRNRWLNESLQGKQPLRNRRLCVIFCDESNDFHKVYEHGIKHGHGTAEEQEIVRKHLDTMPADDEAAQRTQLALSSTARFIKTDGRRATHNVHFVDPKWLTEQIEWVYDGSLVER